MHLTDREDCAARRSEGTNTGLAREVRRQYINLDAFAHGRVSNYGL
jgi:hypothetical protein